MLERVKCWLCLQDGAGRQNHTKPALGIVRAKFLTFPAPHPRGVGKNKHGHHVGQQRAEKLDRYSLDRYNQSVQFGSGQPVFYTDHMT